MSRRRGDISVLNGQSLRSRAVKLVLYPQREGELDKFSLSINLKPTLPKGFCPLVGLFHPEAGAPVTAKADDGPQCPSSSSCSQCPDFLPQVQLPQNGAVSLQEESDKEQGGLSAQVPDSDSQQGLITITIMPKT